ncbi:MAG: hypothetical protein QMC95_01590 [Desulfitobacteriaceae bacterium]|nr:hypothetical protein [Desulfitobacteriaceae bacterium]MDI6877765.1 hypothetical protein [Desulfitobacteriaceae bacterium]MDI6912896.1 hypothetical protein [Desulfitobacteriaceae bacterium]
MNKPVHALLKLMTPFLLLSLLLSGCSNKPFLTPDNTYAIVTYDLKGDSSAVPINLTWNTNTAVLRQLLVEASFVLTDLRSQSADLVRPGKASPLDTVSTSSEPKTYLQTTFPETKMLTFLIDGLNVNLGVQSIEIEVEGDDLGQVVLNHTWVLQGISNPNLYPAYLEFVDMIQGQNKGKSAL